MVKSEKQRIHLEKLNSNRHIKENNPNWKGGRMRNSGGYLMILKHEHPRAKSNKGYVFEHILIMEKKIGRYLNKNEVVHHINGVRDDNRNKNLIIMTKREHTKYHNKEKKGKKYKK